MISWISIAFFLDLVLGDPYHWPHPVKLMGNFINWFQVRFASQRSKKAKYVWGMLLWWSTVLSSGLITYCLLRISFSLHFLVGAGCYIYLAYTTLATKSLALEGKKVYQSLVFGSLTDARKQVAMIVGRDTSELTKEEITKATIETIAENSSDGVIAPLLCLFIGGPTLAMMYKAVNTLDSMVGYLTPKYREIGWFSAKMDDWWNILPARLTWLLLLAATVFLPVNTTSAWKIGKSDCRKHKSPNSGFPESVVAGALEIQLGGTHSYHGVEIYKPTIGVATRPANQKDILTTIQLLYVTAALGLLIFSGGTALINYSCF